MYIHIYIYIYIHIYDIYDIYDYDDDADDDADDDDDDDDDICICVFECSIICIGKILYIYTCVCTIVWCSGIAWYDMVLCGMVLYCEVWY